VFAEDEAALLLASAADRAELDALVVRRVAGVPLEHVLGWAEFGGQRILVEDGVFVPRHRTEFLLDLATALARQDGPRRPTVVVDLCCGSGALGAVLVGRLGSAGREPVGSPRTERMRPPGAQQLDSAGMELVGLPGVELHACDVDPAAVRCARRNVAPLGGHVYEGDLYAALPVGLRGRVNILLANAPYVPTEAIGLLPPEAREYESPVALDGGTDGLAVLRRVIHGAADWLAEGGHLLVEASEGQAADLVAAFAGTGLTTEVVPSDEHEITVVIATRPAAVPTAPAKDGPLA
jgi:release factor glutamine methyltransferase